MSKKDNQPQNIIEITNEVIVNMIHEIRDKKVMLDFELADLYGYETKYLNRQVHRNIEKFPEDFMFRLTSKESEMVSRCQNVTMKIKRGQNIKYLPYAFTEQGIYMLITVLKGEIATKQKNEKLYHCSSSSKDSGNGVTEISLEEKPELFHNCIDSLL